jgi:hypothetical protein
LLALVLHRGSLMSDPGFQKAYQIVRQSYSDEAWAALTPRQITDAIYREIRRIDAPRAGVNGEQPATMTGQPS